jgi:hypothetical protein
MSYQRRPLDLVVSGTHPSLVAAALHSFGGNTITLGSLAVTGVIRRTGAAAIAAHAVVIDGQGYGTDDGTAVRRAMALASDLRALPGYVFQPNGTRWKNTPIFIVVRDDGLAWAVNEDHTRAVGLSAMSGWRAIYDAIDALTLQYQQAVLDDMWRLGVRTGDLFGRVVRLGPPMPPKRGGTREVETDLYALDADVSLRRDRRRPWTARDVALMHPEALGFDFRDAEEILERAHLEPKLQKLCERGAYFSEATSHEVFPHARITTPDGFEHVTDLAVRSAATNTLRIDELKTRQMPTYREHFLSDANRNQVKAIFGEIPGQVTARLVAGDTRKITPETYGRIRSSVAGDVDHTGVNDMLERAIERLTR